MKTNAGSRIIIRNILVAYIFIGIYARNAGNIPINAAKLDEFKRKIYNLRPKSKNKE